MTFSVPPSTESPADNTITVIVTKKNLDILNMAISGDREDFQKLRDGNHLRYISYGKANHGMDDVEVPTLSLKKDIRFLLTKDGWKLWCRPLIFDIKAVEFKKTRVHFTYGNIHKPKRVPSGITETVIVPTSKNRLAQLESILQASYAGVEFEHISLEHLGIGGDKLSLLPLNRSAGIIPVSPDWLLLMNRDGQEELRLIYDLELMKSRVAIECYEAADFTGVTYKKRRLDEPREPKQFPGTVLDDVL